jgi:putative transposase
MESLKGRRVWYKYWDTCLTYKTSYYARLNYVIQNPVKHKLIDNSRNYKWCSASWFSEIAEDEFKNMVYSFKMDNINIQDDF